MILLHIELLLTYEDSLLLFELLEGLVDLLLLPLGGLLINFEIEGRLGGLLVVWIPFLATGQLIDLLFWSFRNFNF